MLFYGKYENGWRYICAYNEEKHGMPRVVSDCLTFIYHNSVSVNRVCKTEREAMADSWVGSIAINLLSCQTVQKQHRRAISTQKV